MSSKKAPPQKEAVVFILDAFPSMNAPYPTHKQQQPDAGAFNPNPNQSANPDENFPTRLECAKQAIESMLFNMMLNSRSDSKALVIVTKTKKTRHHLIALDEDPDDKSLRGNVKFPNLTELGWIKHQTTQEQVMRPPDVRMIRQLWKVQPVASIERAQSQLQGDICDALILAADALYRCAYANPKSKSSYRYRRKIVLLTDACHQIVLDLSQVCLIIDNLRKMECPLHVLGMGFGSQSVEYENPLDASLAAVPREDDTNDDLQNTMMLGHPDQPATKKVKQEPGTIDNLNGDNVNIPRPDEVPSAEEEQVAGQYLRVYETCQDREQLLGSISEKTGGSVISIASMQELLDAKVGKRIRKGSPRNLQLHAGPGMTIAVKALKLLVQEGMPKIIKHAVTMDHRGAPQLNGIGQEMSEPTTEIRTFWRHINAEQAQQDGSGDEADPSGTAEGEEVEDELVEVAEEDITTAIRYGKDLIPWGEQDKAGLKVEEDCGYSDTTFDAESPYIHILGYVRRDAIQYRLIVGPPYGITGSISKRACTVVAALARTLHESEFVALCTLKLSKTGIPCLAGLFPFEEGTKTDRLLLFKLPFCDDVKCFGLEGFQDILDDEEGGEESNQKSQSQHSIKSLHSSKNQASDDLIDSLMLPDDVICSGKIPSPFHTSFNKTILKRATATEQERRNEMDDIVAVREQLDLMAIPKEVMEGSAPALEKFREAFPLKMKKVVVKAAAKGGRGGGRKNPTFRDHL